MLGRNRKNIIREFVKRRRERFLHLRIDFVRQDQQRLARTAQQVREFGIERRKSRARIDDQQQLRCAFDGHLRLAKNFARDGSLIVRHDPARIDHFKGAALPRRGAIDAVARNSGLVRDNRAPRASQPVKNRRFPNIRASNNHYRCKLFSHKERHNEPQVRGSGASTVPYCTLKQKLRSCHAVGQMQRPENTGFSAMKCPG